LAELYSEADLIFVPSWFESFPLQPIEAMACGTAVVTTKIGTEDYARDNDTAIVIEPRNSNSLAFAIINLINDVDLRNRISRAGLRESQKFTWEHSAKEIKSAFGL
jgi:glycosyltransferase involved in cell wall biosynthesis